MSQFEVYYQSFLGLKDQQQVVESEYRDVALNEKFFYPIIVSEDNNQRICSTSPRYLEICKSTYNGSLESLEEVVDTLNANGECLRIRRFRRYAIEDMGLRYDTRAVALTEDQIRRVGYGINDKETYISRKNYLLEAKRDYVVTKDDIILSKAYISDINAGGCNIVVNTHQGFKRQGFGREVVKACINWCLENDLVPIYWVEESNVASILLAESLGFEFKCTEWIVSK